MRMIKNGSTTTLAFGAGFIQRLQHLSLYLAEGKTSEDMEEFRAAVAADTVKTIPWMYNLHTVVSLLTELETAAHHQGNTQDVPDEELLSAAEVITEEQ